MNDIVKPLTPDGMCGWDEFGQLCLWKVDGDRRVGTLIGDPRGHTCRICQQGWALTIESLEDQMYWSDFREWVHRSCSIRYSALKERDKWFWALVDAGIRFDGLQEIPNGYWHRDPWRGKKPWYRVKLLDSERTLKLGFRKRVSHMEIESGTGSFSRALAEELFKDENGTKQIGDDSVLIHAWTDEKALEYLKAFARIMALRDPHESVKR